MAAGVGEDALGLNEGGVTWADRLALSSGEDSEASDGEAGQQDDEFATSVPRSPPGRPVLRRNIRSGSSSPPPLRSVQFREQICDTRLLPTGLQTVSLLVDPSAPAAPAPAAGAELTDHGPMHSAELHSESESHHRSGDSAQLPSNVRPSSSLPLGQELAAKPQTPSMEKPTELLPSMPGSPKMAKAVDRKPKRSSSRPGKQRGAHAGVQVQGRGSPLKFPKIASTHSKTVQAKHCAMFVRKSASFGDQAMQDKVRAAYYFNRFAKACRRQRQGRCRAIHCVALLERVCHCVLCTAPLDGPKQKLWSSLMCGGGKRLVKLYACMHVRTHKHKHHARARAHTHAPTHPRTHPRTYAHTHARTHTHTHRRTDVPSRAHGKRDSCAADIAHELSARHCPNPRGLLRKHMDLSLLPLPWG